MKSTLIIIIAVLIGFFGARIIANQKKTSEEFQKSLEIAKQNNSHNVKTDNNENDIEIIQPIELNDKEKLQTAIISFKDFQYNCCEGYKNYCAEYNVNIDKFINKFDEINKKYEDFIKDKMIKNQTPEQIESVNKNIDFQVRTIQNGNFNPEEFCKSLNAAADSDEINSFDFNSVSPEMAEILLTQ